VITIYWFDTDNMTRIERLHDLSQKLEKLSKTAIDSAYAIREVSSCLRELIEMMIQDELRMKTLLQAGGVQTVVE